MKKINKLRLNQLSKTEIEKRVSNTIRGGQCPCICGGGFCSCDYQGPQCPVGDDYWGGASYDYRRLNHPADNTDQSVNENFA